MCSDWESNQQPPDFSFQYYSSKRAEAAFMKALEWTDKIKSTLKAVEYNDMKARALLNLGEANLIFL